MSRASWFGLAAGLALAVAPATPAVAQQDFSKVEMKVVPVSGSIYMLQGAGGNIGVSAGPDGILIIDDQYSRWPARSGTPSRGSTRASSSSSSTPTTTATTRGGIRASAPRRPSSPRRTCGSAWPPAP